MALVEILIKLMAEFYKYFNLFKTKTNIRQGEREPNYQAWDNMVLGYNLL